MKKLLISTWIVVFALCGSGFSQSPTPTATPTPAKKTAKTTASPSPQEAASPADKAALKKAYREALSAENIAKRDYANGKVTVDKVREAQKRTQEAKEALDKVK